MSTRNEIWYDDDSGPLVRLYAQIGGWPATAATPGDLDLNALVARTEQPVAAPELSPPESRILQLTVVPTSVSEIAAQLDLPIGAVRGLLRGLSDAGLVAVRRPAADDDYSPSVLEQLLTGLRAL